MPELIDKWEVVNKLIQLENNYQFYKEQWDADVLYRRICELEIGIGKTPGVTVQEWIPASEPPKEPGEYNVVQKHWLDGHLESKRGKWNGVEWFVDGKESLMVTHWMPLPQPPKGE